MTKIRGSYAVDVPYIMQALSAAVLIACLSIKKSLN